MHQPLQRGGPLLAQRLGLERLPLIEGRAVLECEARQIVAAVERDGLAQPVQAFRADLSFWMAVLLPGREQASERIHIDLKPGAGVDADSLSPCEQALPAQGCPEQRQSRSKLPVVSSVYSNPERKQKRSLGQPPVRRASWLEEGVSRNTIPTHDDSARGRS